MGMAGELQRHPRRHPHRNVRLMRQQHDRRVVGDFPERRGKVVDADTFAGPESPRRHVSQLIAEPGEPERPAGLAQPRHIETPLDLAGVLVFYRFELSKRGWSENGGAVVESGGAVIAFTTADGPALLRLTPSER